MSINNTFATITTSIQQPVIDFSIGKIGFITSTPIIKPEGKNYIGPFSSLEAIKNIVPKNTTIYSMVETAIGQTQSFLQAGSSASYVIYQMQDVVEATQSCVTTKEIFTTIETNLEDLKLVQSGNLNFTMDGKNYTIDNINLSKINSLDPLDARYYSDILNIIVEQLQNKSQILVERVDDEIKFSNFSYGTDGGVPTFTSSTLTTLLKLTGNDIVESAGYDASGFDINKFIEDLSFNDEEFLFYSFTTDLKLDLNTIKSTISKLVYIDNYYNRKMTFFYQLPSLKMSQEYNEKLETVTNNYPMYFGTFTALDATSNAANGSAALMSYCCSVSTNIIGTYKNTAIDLNGHSLNYNIDKSTKIFTQEIAKTLDSYISYYSNQITLGDIIQCPIGNLWQPTDASYMTTIIEHVKLKIANYFKVNRRVPLSLASLSSLKQYLYDNCECFLINNVLNIDAKESDLLRCSVSNKDDLIEKIQEKGIYFEFPDIQTIQTNDIPLSMVVSLARGIVKVNIGCEVLR